MQDYHDLVNTILNELETTLRTIDSDAVSDLGRDITQARRIFLVGKGRTGLQMQAFAMRLMHLDLNVHVVGDVTSPALGAGDLLIIGSASGKTTGLLNYAKRARQLNAQVTLITAAKESPIHEFSDCVIDVVAPSLRPDSEDTSIQPMGSVFHQALFILFDAIIVQLMATLGIDSEMMFARHANLE